MKKIISMLLVVLLLISCVFTTTTVYASKKIESTRAIAIVFDNSGSMYLDKKQDWCRATYAMEVFASMLNKGDTLTIYPMHPIEVEDKSYTMENPFKITDASQSAKIRDIYTPNAGGTPIKSIDCAAEGLKAATCDKKYMIVLTDGDSFDSKSANETKKMLDNRFKGYAGPEMTVMYLGVGKQTVMPSMAESEYFVKKHAKNSEDVLSSLTEMCNMIFGRDSLPKNHIKDKKIDFDISMNKVIVFVQGKDVSGLKVTGASGEMGTKAGSAATKYSEKGCGKTIDGMIKATPDTSLQGMMVTYTDCAAGQYNIEFSGKATSIEVYYEPDVDLDFVFTDSEGNMVDPKELYEGDYKVSFGMKDAKTDQLVESDLLGKPKYYGTYTINGKETAVQHEGLSGEVPISLKMGDTFEAELTATYLDGYKISKDSTDFGWPKGGIKVAARPAGDLKLKIKGGSGTYYLQELENGEPFIAEVYYQGNKLTGKELESVKLDWKVESSNAEIKKEFANDHYKLTLHYKDPKSPSDTVCGKCKVAIKATYAAKGSNESKAQATLSYRINDDFSPVNVNLFAPDDYIVISELEQSSAIKAELTLKGKPLTAEQFKNVTLKVDCSGLEHKITPNPEDSSYSIKLLPTKDVEEKDYPIKVTAKYIDKVGRETTSEDDLEVTLSNTPLWLKWLIGILLLLLLLFIIWRIMRIRVLPSNKILHKRGESYLSVNGKEIERANLTARRNGKKLVFKATYSGSNFIINVPNIEPGKESYLSKRSIKRSILINPKNVSKVGSINYVDIGGVAFKADKNGKLAPEDENQKPFVIRNNTSVAFDGNVEENGRTKKFHAEIPLTFKKR